MLIHSEAKGPWYEAVNFLESSQFDINTICGKFSSELDVPLVNFFEDGTRNISSELEVIFSFLNSVDMTSKQHVAAHISLNLRKYIAEVMAPKLKRLEVIILLNAFMLKGKPICNLFYCFDKISKKLVMREAKSFYNLVAGSFMVMYYKVGNLIYLKY